MRTQINIDVPELGPAIRFYTEALGLQHTRTIDGDVAELVGAASTIYLLAYAEGSMLASHERRHYSRHWTPVHIDFIVEDLEQATQRAIKAGAVQEGDGVEWMGSRCNTFADPFGHGFCLIEYRNYTYEVTPREQ